MASVSKAQICNLALAHINQTESGISNLVTDKGNTADQCRTHYDVARRFVLSDHHWNFATKRVVLADIDNPPATYLHRYDYPSDCLKFQSIQRDTRNDLPIPYVIEDDGTGEGLSVLTDRAEAIGIYTRDVENTSLFIPGFVSSLGWHLASELAPALTGDLNLQEACLTIYRNYIASAQSVDSGEGDQDDELDEPWERARIGGSDVD